MFSVRLADAMMPKCYVISSEGLQVLVTVIAWTFVIVRGMSAHYVHLVIIIKY